MSASTPDRLPCRTPGCPGRILPETAERTGGLCMPCVKRPGVAEAQRVWEAEMARAADARRQAVALLEPATDPLDQLQSRHGAVGLAAPLPRFAPHGGDIADVYASLDQQQADRWVQIAVADGSLSEMAPFFAAFVRGDLTSLQRALLDADEIFPPEAFRAAGAEVVARLLGLTSQALGVGDRAGVWRSLCALAWSRHPLALDQLRIWSRDPPPGYDTALGPLSQHTRVAGYELEDGTARELTVAPCYALRVHAEGEAAPRSARQADVRLLDPIEHGPRCPHCDRPGRFLIAFEEGDRPDGLDGLPSRVPTCLACLTECVGTLFVRYAEDESWSFLGPLPSDHPVPDGYRSREDVFPEEGRRATLVERAPHASLVGPDGRSLSQLGGYPYWVQREDRPNCPGCRRVMTNIAVVAPGDWDAYEEVFYVHRCRPCGVLAVAAQR